MLTIEERPFSWDAIVGHQLIVNEMKEHSKAQTFPSVMVFQGQTGTGKTTMARLVGATIADKNPIIHDDGVKEPNPESQVCQSIIQETYSGDVKYYDCSVMTKDHVKALKDQLNSRSLTGGHRVFILDEFQELNSHSRGAVLNLLEKKYRKTTLILTTMNPEKIDTAILSRCTPYNFRSPSEDDIAEHLYNLSVASGVELPESHEDFITNVCFTLAQACRGSVRLAMVYLQRCLSSKLFTEEEVATELGLISNNRLDQICTKLFVHNEYAEILKFKEFDFSEVFYKTRKALLNAYLYHLTGKVTHKWQKRLYEALKGAPVEALMDAYSKTEEKGYLREDVFQFEVLRTLSGHETETKKKDPVPVRQIVERVPLSA